MKVIIVGGVAGGATAAARIRRLDEKAEIKVFEKSGFVSYANCGLPYYIGGVIEDPEELTLQSPESFYERFRIDVKVNHEVMAIHPKDKNVVVKNLETGEEWEESYDKLLLSPGAKPIIPDMPGTELPEVFSLRTVEDTFAIRNFVDNEKPKTAIISGGGFIGLEVAENLVEQGVKVTIVQMDKQVMSPLDPEMASFIHGELRNAGVELVLENTLTEIGYGEKGDKKKLLCKLQTGETLEADMAILAIGVLPENKLAKEAGLDLGMKGAIVVNDRLETSAKDVYAVGDAIQVKQYTTGKDAVISLAGPANKQGRIAADNICGLDSRFEGSQGSSVIKLFNLTIASTGINEKIAAFEGLNYDKIYLSPTNHAGYYPGGKLMTMKVLFDPKEDKLLGAQIVGYDGVDKRIDVLATAMHAKVPASKLKELDLAYAPPYSSAKDPVNMAGFMIENIEEGRVKQFFFDDVAELPKDGSVTLLDARTEEEYEEGHAEGFINIPVDELRERMEEIPKEKPLYVMCQSGLRSYVACRILMQEGYDAYNFAGGYRLYEAIATDKAMAQQAYPCGMDRK